MYIVATSLGPVLARDALMALEVAELVERYHQCCLNARSAERKP